MTAARQMRQAAGAIRPLDPFRDLEQVVDLIGVAFGERLDPAGRATLDRMQRLARRGPVVQWAWALLGKATIAPGLVWVVDGHVLGNISLRRARGYSGYLIGNVVVHPDQRGRGIGSALLRKAIDVISRRGAPWVGLEVRADNEVARRLYERFGFREVGRTRHLLLAPDSARVNRPSRPDVMRRGRWRDGDDLIQLVEAVVPEGQRSLLEIRQDDYRPSWRRRVERWLRGEDEVWWVVEEDDGDDRNEGVELRGAVRSVRKRAAFPHRMEVLVRPGAEGHVEADLVGQGVASLAGIRRKSIEVSLPGATAPLVMALREKGFQDLRILIQMKRTLRHRVSVHVKR